MAKKTDDILDSLDDEISVFLNKFFNANVGQVNHFNEENFKIMYDQWFCCEAKKSYVQAAIVFRKKFPTNEPEEEQIKKLADDIIQYKIGCHAKTLKDNISFLQVIDKI